MDVAQAGRENVNSGGETKTPEKTPTTEAVVKIEGGTIFNYAMDVAQAGRENIDSVGETKTPEKTPIAEAVVKIEGGVDSRPRRRSKYLSSPYTNSGPRHKDLPAEKEAKTPRTANKPKASTKTSNRSNGSSSFAKSGSKRFQNNWYKKFISCSSMSSSPELINASSGDLLSGLCSIAVDCMFPIEDKSFDLVEWFICRYRISEFHDEAELAASLVNLNGGKNGNPVGNVILDTNSEKKRKSNKMENSGRYKRKYLSGLSDVNTNASTGGREPAKNSKVGEVTSFHQPQHAETTLKESGNECSSVPEIPQNLSFLPSEGKTGPKKRKKMEAAQEHESAQCTGSTTMSEGKLKQKRKLEQVTSLLQLQNPETTLIESANKSGSVPESPQNLSCLASKGKAKPRKRVNTKAAQEHQGAPFVLHVDAKGIEKAAQEHQGAPVVSHVDAKSIECSSLALNAAHQGSAPETPQNFSCLASKGKTKPRKRVNMKAAQEHQGAPFVLDVDAKSIQCSSLVIDLQISPPPPVPVDIHEKSNAEVIGSNPEERVSQDKLVGNVTNGNLLVSTASEVGSASQEGLVGNITNHNLLGDSKSDVGIVSKSKTGPKNRTEKAQEKHHSTNRAIEIPDLNGTSFESFPTGKEFESVNFLSIELKSDQPRSLSACTRSVNFNRVEENGESHGTCLLLQFAPEVNIPSREDLLTTFCRFGPLKASETQLLKDTASARIVFVRSTDAEAAFGSLELNKPFGEALLNYRLDHLPAVAPPVEPIVTPVTLTQPNGSMSTPGDAPPPLHLMKKNLQLMTSMLENSGNNLSPQMRAKLDSEIKNLMRKVDSRGKV